MTDRTSLWSRATRSALAVPVLLVTLAGLLTACSEEDTGDQLQVVENPTAAVAATSPEPAVAPAGTVIAQEGEIRALATDPASRTLAVALAEPPAVLLYDLDRPDAPPKRVELPAATENLTVAHGTVLAPLTDAELLARITLPTGELSTVPVAGGPAGVAVRGERTLVALRDQEGIAVLEDEHIVKTITAGLYSADDVLTVGDDTFVLDRLRTAVFSVNVPEGTIGEGLRAGLGATNAVVDSFDRMLVADTRGGGLLAFSSDPLLLRQRYPVPGGLYGLAYDAEHDLVWVTLTERNEVVGFDVRGGEPAEVHRYPTVRQPNSVTVDEQTSQVIVGSATGEGIQVITP